MFSSTRSRTIRNTKSARVSVPSLLREKDEHEDGKTSPDQSPSTGQQRPWIWRTDLAATKPFWEDWFVGLSRKFLEAKGGKLLLLAGTDRLDKELMIGQMQGMLTTFNPFFRFGFYFLVVLRVKQTNWKEEQHWVFAQINQKTGKYQLQVLPDAGHFIHEDQPLKTAQILVDFYKRNDRGALVLPPKVGDMMASKAMEKGKSVDMEK
jgi:protein phosphatase methylesterase 1